MVLNVRTLIILLSVFSTNVFVLADLLPPRLANLANEGQPVSAGTVPAGQSVTFSGLGKFVCPDGGPIAEYRWVLPSQACSVKGETSSSLTCKFSTWGSQIAVTYEIELQVRCSHGVWNTEYATYNMGNNKFVYSITVEPTVTPWYVSRLGNDSNNGQSSEQAFRNIQTAIDVASDAHEIIVASGTAEVPVTYYEQLDLKGKSLNIHTDAPEDWIRTQNTIIDAHKQGTGVIFRSNESVPGENVANFKGFAITGGHPAGDGLALYLPFDEGSGTAVVDQSEKDRHGTLSGPSWTGDGYSGSGLEFSDHDCITFDGFAGINGKNSRTCSAWIKPNVVSGPVSIISWGKITAADSKFVFGLVNNKLCVYTHSYGVVSYNIINDSLWHHVAAVLESDGSPTLKDVKLYVDGVLQSVYYTGSPEVPVNTEPGAVYVGAYDYEGETELSAWYQGTLDEVRVYSRALSEEELKQQADYPLAMLELSFDQSCEDVSANNQAVVKQGGDPVWTTGISGSALSFNGTSDYVSCITDCSETAHAVSLWFKTTSVNVGVFSVSALEQGMDHDRHMYLLNGNLCARIWSNETISTSGLNLADDQWHHVVHTFGGSVGGQRIYVDGQLKASGLKAVSNFDWDTRVHIGYSKDSVNPYFTGVIDEVKVFRRALTSEDVAVLAGTTFFCEARWTLDGDAADSAGNHDGTLFGSPAEAAGYWQQSLAFSGDDYITVPYAEQLNSENFTIALWAKVTGGQSTWRAAISSRDTANQQSTGYVLFAGSDNNWRFGTGNGTSTWNNVWDITYDSLAVEIGQWTHIAVSFEVTGWSGGFPVGNQYFYLNGKLAAEVNNVVYHPCRSANLSFLIGADGTAAPYTNFWQGNLDDVRVYSRALLASEICELADLKPRLVAHFKLDESTADQVSDQTAAGNPAAYSDGMIGEGAEFTGNEYLHLQDSRGVLGKNPRTVSAWVKNEGEISNEMICAWGKCDFQDLKKGFGLCVAGNNLAIGIAGPYRRGKTIISDGQWHHVAAVLGNYENPTLGDVVLYIDGQYEPTYYTANEAELINTFDGDITIGGAIFTGDDLQNQFTGEIDDVRIYNYGLTPGEVYSLYQTRFADGGGVKGHGVAAAFAHCIIRDNLSQVDGGGLSNVDGSITNCFITENVSDANGGGLANCNGDIINCVIAENSAENAGAILGGSGAIVHCTIADNIAANSIGGISGYGGAVANTIMWRNSDTDQLTSIENEQICGGTPGVNYCCIQDDPDDPTVPFASGFGNKDEDPFFVGFLSGTLLEHLFSAYNVRSDSPCRDQGFNGVPELLEINSDIIGNDRFYDGDQDGNPTTDIGAYEFRPIIYVDSSAFASGDGTTWAKAFRYLPDALASASSGTEVWVAGGEYYPDQSNSNPFGSGDISVEFHIADGVRVYGGFDSTDIAFCDRNPLANRTVLSGDIGVQGNYADNVKRVVNLGGNSLLDGFVVSSGVAGVSCYSQTLSQVENCMVIDNADGIVVYVDSNVGISNNVIAGNTRNGIIAVMARPYIHNNVIAQNTNGLSLFAYTPVAISNNTIADNLNVGIYSGGCEAPSVVNCILWENGSHVEGVTDITFSCVQGGCAGIGNINLNPYFINPDERNYRLQSYSTCIDNGDPSMSFEMEPDYPDGHINIGAYGNTPYAAVIGSGDTDGDGILDVEEVRNLKSNANNVDSDGDGLVDGAGGTIFTTNYPDGVDSNGDEYVDGELDRGTDLLDPDTDNDGFDDGIELARGTDPHNDADICFYVTSIGSNRVQIGYAVNPGIVIRSVSLLCSLSGSYILTAEDVQVDQTFNCFMDYLKDCPGTPLESGHPVTKINTPGVPDFGTGLTQFGINMLCFDSGRNPAPERLENAILIQLYGTGEKTVEINEDSNRSSFIERDIKTNLPITIAVND